MPTYTPHALDLIVYLADHPGARALTIMREQDFSRATFTRALAEARRLGMKIAYSHEQGYRITAGNVSLARRWIGLNAAESPLA